MRADPHQVIEDTGDLVEHDANVLGADRRLDAKQFLHRQDIGVLITHHGDVIEAIHIRQTLHVVLALGQFFRGPVQQPDMRIGTLDNLTIHLQHQAQHTVRGRMLRAEIKGEIPDL